MFEVLNFNVDLALLELAVREGFSLNDMQQRATVYENLNLVYEDLTSGERSDVLLEELKEVSLDDLLGYGLSSPIEYVAINKSVVYPTAYGFVVYGEDIVEDAVRLGSIPVNGEAQVAVGSENGKYYVQLADVDTDTHLSESIEEGLNCKIHALAIAKFYSDMYELDFVDWTSKKNEKPKVHILLHEIEYEFDGFPDLLLSDSEKEEIAYEISSGFDSGQLERWESNGDSPEDIVGWWKIKR